MNGKKITELIVVAMLTVVLLFAVINAIKRTEKISHPKVKIPATNFTVKDTTNGNKTSSKKTSSSLLYNQLEQESKNLALGRDPFTGDKIISQETSTSTIYLSGIFWDQAQPMAIINDNIVKIGDRIDRYKVVQISQDRVILNDGRRDLELKWQR